MRHASGLKISGYYDLETLMESTRSYHRLHLSIPFINTNSYRFSYFPVKNNDEWNHLPHHLLELDCVDLFVVNVIANNYLIMYSKALISLSK